MSPHRPGNVVGKRDGQPSTLDRTNETFFARLQQLKNARNISLIEPRFAGDVCRPIPTLFKNTNSSQEVAVGVFAACEIFNEAHEIDLALAG